MVRNVKHFMLPFQRFIQAGYEKKAICFMFTKPKQRNESL